VPDNLALLITTHCEIKPYDEHHGLHRELFTTLLWIFALAESSTVSMLPMDVLSRMGKPSVGYKPSSAGFSTADRVHICAVSTLVDITDMPLEFWISPE